MVNCPRTKYILPELLLRYVILHVVSEKYLDKLLLSDAYAAYQPIITSRKQNDLRLPSLPTWFAQN